MPSSGGPVLAAPQLVTLTFGDDPDADEMQAFARWIVTSDWLREIGSEYGVGPGTSQRVDMSVVNATITDDDIRSWMRYNLSAGYLPAPGDPSAPRLYVWLLGPGAKMTDPNGDCTGGYHDDMQFGSQNVPYAVVPLCPNDTVPGLTPLQYRQGRASHELAEAFTDPLATSDPAYVFVDNEQVWTSTFGEVGDVCVWNYLPFTSPDGQTFYAQRTWSNVAAARGGDPCVPRPIGLAYFNVTASPGGVIKVKPGSTVRVRLTGWTVGFHAAWPIYVGTSAWSDFDSTPQLSPATIGAGGHAAVTLHVPQTALPGQHASVTIDSDDGHTNSLWPIAVEVQ
jgi:hypothetical protein